MLQVLMQEEKPQSILIWIFFFINVNSDGKQVPELSRFKLTADLIRLTEKSEISGFFK
jgi:hypothetical protein